MTINVGSQRFWAVARQVLAYLAVGFGVLTQAVSGLHLPVALSTALAVMGGVLINVEHYVADPTTGTSPAPTPPTTPTQPTSAPAPAQPASAPTP